MAANTGIIEGQDLLVYVAGTAIAHSTTCTLSPTVETRDRVTKDTGKWKTKKAGMLDWEVTAEALAMYGAGNYHTLLAAMITRADVTIKFAGRDASVDPTNDNFTTEQTGDTYYEGPGIITQLPQTAPNNADATFTITITGNGELETKTAT
ncbi:MAG: phage tail tube protein [Desulfotomaculaceae bacterium]